MKILSKNYLKITHIHAIEIKLLTNWINVITYYLLVIIIIIIINIIDWIFYSELIKRSFKYNKLLTLHNILGII